MQEAIKEYKSRPVKQKFMNGVSAHWKIAEKWLLPEASLRLSQWAGKHLWTSGYKAEDIQIVSQALRCNTHLGIGIKVYGTKEDTTRQLIYQYIKFAEEVIEENDRLSAELDRIKSSFWYKVTHILVPILRYRIFHKFHRSYEYFSDAAGRLDTQ